MYNYVILDDDQVVTAVGSTLEMVAPPGAMAIANYDPTLMGQRWTGTGWEPGNTRPEPITQLDFLRRFTTEERIAIRASTDAVVQDFLHLLGLAQDIRVDDADTVAGVNYLEQESLLATGRAAAILG
jgi:hypothetical protein